ncbi:MAG TPA: amidase [Mycobacteriales bacterium]|nr:amidase [Mycobacteriales bacterium]
MVDYSVKDATFYGEAAMRADEYVRHDGVGLADLVRSGQVSPVELQQAAQSVLDAVNGRINAVVTGDLHVSPGPSGAPDEAAFSGVPLLAKDNHPCAGLPARHGSAFRSATPEAGDHPVVGRLRAAGANPVGMTNMPEAGLLATTQPALYGACRNPWDLGRTAGGSSGGSAAAVIAGIAPIATGSDGGGSIRIPASACGVFGLKPSRGRTPGIGWGGLVVNHVLTRSVRDSAVALDLLSRAGPDAPNLVSAPSRPFATAVTAEPGRLRIAFSVAPPDGFELHCDVVAAVRHAAQLLESLGHDVAEDHLDVTAGPLAAVTERLEDLVPVATAARVQTWAEESGSELTETGVEPLTWRYIERGRAVSGPAFAVLLDALPRFAEAAAPFFARYDLWLLPTTAEPPPPLDCWNFAAPTLDDALTRMTRYVPGFVTSLANITGQPAASVPFTASAEGLPVGVQLVARHYREDLLLGVAGQIERARPWPVRAPVTP